MRETPIVAATSTQLWHAPKTGRVLLGIVSGLGLAVCIHAIRLAAQEGNLLHPSPWAVLFVIIAIGFYSFGIFAGVNWKFYTKSRIITAGIVMICFLLIAILSGQTELFAVYAGPPLLIWLLTLFRLRKQNHV